MHDLCYASKRSLYKRLSPAEGRNRNGCPSQPAYVNSQKPLLSSTHFNLDPTHSRIPQQVFTEHPTYPPISTYSTLSTSKLPSSTLQPDLKRCPPLPPNPSPPATSTPPPLHLQSSRPIKCQIQWRMRVPISRRAWSFIVRYCRVGWRRISESK